LLFLDDNTFGWLFDKLRAGFSIISPFDNPQREQNSSGIYEQKYWLWDEEFFNNHYPPSSPLTPESQPVDASPEEHTPSPDPPIATQLLSVGNT